MIKDINVLYSYLKDSIECFSQLTIPSKKISEIQNGMIAVLFHLEEKKDLDVNASDIANLLNISNARVAKLIIKLEKEKLITKYKACMDSRMVILKITDKGRDVVVNKYRELMNFFNYLREEIGEEKLTQFYCLSKKIKIATIKYKELSND